MSDAETLGWGDRWRAHLEVAAMGAGEDLAAGRVIAAVLPRRTYLERPSPSGRSVGQPIAANIDVVLIVEPMDPTPSVGRVERFAAMSRSAGAEAWLVLTKTDLVAPEVVGEALTGMAPWVDAAVGVTSADPTSTERLRTLLPKGATAVLVGRSGAGKSTLLNTILGADHATGEVRSSDSKGRHTTTRRELLARRESPSSTPRECGLWPPLLTGRRSTTCSATSLTRRPHAGTRTASTGANRAAPCERRSPRGAWIPNGSVATSECCGSPLGWPLARMLGTPVNRNAERLGMTVGAGGASCASRDADRPPPTRCRTGLRGRGCRRRFRGRERLHRLGSPTRFLTGRPRVLIGARARERGSQTVGSGSGPRSVRRPASGAPRVLGGAHRIGPRPHREHQARSSGSPSRDNANAGPHPRQVLRRLLPLHLSGGPPSV